MSTYSLKNPNDKYRSYSEILLFQTVTNHVFNFHVIVHELHTAKQDSYKIELMTCMSSILAAAEDLEMRIRLRNELIGLYLRSTAVINVVAKILLMYFSDLAFNLRIRHTCKQVSK